LWLLLVVGWLVWWQLNFSVAVRTRAGGGLLRQDLSEHAGGGWAGHGPLQQGVQMCARRTKVKKKNNNNNNNNEACGRMLTCG
jgi:hypothetical protein